MNGKIKNLTFGSVVNIFKNLSITSASIQGSFLIKTSSHITENLEYGLNKTPEGPNVSKYSLLCKQGYNLGTVVQKHMWQMFKKIEYAEKIKKNIDRWVVCKRLKLP